MACKSIHLFDLNVMNATKEQALNALFEKGKQKKVAFLNAHCVNVARQDKEYHSVLKNADFILPDGSGLELAARLKSAHFTENLNGTDLASPLLERAAQEGQSVFLLGAGLGVAEEMAQKAQIRTPGLKIAGTHHGFFGKEKNAEIIEKINKSCADIVLVAFGVPLQEKWIEENSKHLQANLIIGVGAMFDFYSGRVSRAPELLRSNGFEWVWRLSMEPRRLFRRYVIGNPIFIIHAISDYFKTDALGHRKTPLWKRLFDITGSLVALALLTPVFLLLAILIKLDSKGSVFFVQERVGKNGRSFKMYKFRSMVKNAEAQRQQLFEQSDREGICFKHKSDPRVTRIGRFIRRYSLDELPQFFNVLKGEMSLVGPRPALLEEVQKYPAVALQRFNTLPGITGAWQVSGRADIGFEEMIEMDINYTKNISVKRDITLLLMTFKAVLNPQGAY